MKNQWFLYAIVVLVSIGAGVLIAGLPDTAGSAGTITAPPATNAPAPDTTAAPPATTTAPPTTVAQDDPPADSTTTTSVSEPTTTVTEPTVAVADLVVVAANGAGTQGLAASFRDELTFLGFEQARATDGTTVVDETAVYFYDGFEREAVAIAQLFEIDADLVQPVADAPEYGALDGDQVVVYLGRDRS